MTIRTSSWRSAARQEVKRRLLFAADSIRMYTRFAERQGWKVEVLDANVTGLGGLKEVVFSIQGKGLIAV